MGLLVHSLPRLGSARRGHRIQPILYHQLLSLGDLYPMLCQRILQGLPLASFLLRVIQLERSKGVLETWRAWNHDALC